MNPWINSLKGAQLQCLLLYPQSVTDQSQFVSTTTLTDQSVTIYKDTSVGEFCPAVDRGQAISTAGNYRVESTSDDSHIGIMNCTALSVELETGWAVVDEMRHCSL